MPVVLFRVDDRLVHGQVVEGWVPHLKADAIVVASDKVCADAGRGALIRMSAPEGLVVETVRIAELGRCLNEMPTRKILVLFETLDDVQAAADGGLGLPILNIGNLHHHRGGVEMTPSVFLDRRDLAIAIALMSRGIQIQLQEVPSGRCCDLVDLLEDNLPET